MDFNCKTVLDGEQNPSLDTVQLKEFCLALRENRKPIAARTEVRNTMMILDAIRKYDSKGKIVHLDG